MIKEVKYSGVSVFNSDHDAVDGELDVAMNLIPDISGALRPVLPPSIRIEDLTYPAIAIHTISSNQKNLILYDSLTGRVLYRPLHGGDASSITFCNFPSKPAVAILGNTLFLSDGSSSMYILWSSEDNSYIKLGSGIPEIDIDLALGRDSDSPLADTLTIPIPDGVSGTLAISILGGLPGGRRLVPPRDNNGIFVEAVDNAVLGFINKSVADAHDDDLFVMPFIARWALKLYDGSYIHQSAPILMIPNSKMPRLYFTSSTTNNTVTMNVTLPLRRCSLLFRASGLASLSKWKDIVKSIDFFVSAPIYIYDQSGSVSTYHRLTNDDLPFSFSGLASSVVSSEGQSIPDDEYLSGHRHHNSVTSSSEELKKFSGSNIESPVTYPATGSCVVPASIPLKNIEDKVSETSLFYLISSVPVEDIDITQNSMDGFLRLDIADSALSNITVRPRLADDWRSHDLLSFNHAFSYNSRLILSGVSAMPFNGFSLPSMSQYYYDPEASDVECSVWIKIVRNSTTFWVKSETTLPSGHLPRFLYYPDPNATECRIICHDGTGGWRLPFKTHDFLNGAYWFDGLSSARTPKSEDIATPTEVIVPDEESEPLPVIIQERNKVFQSEVNNPFLFPVEGRIAVGTGEVMATSAAVRALSQGQFGQFPVYAFASDGIWALDTTSTGTFSAVRPISRDVCMDPGAIAQIDDAVLFPSRRGIMLLSAAQSSSFSDVIESEYPFQIQTLPSWNAICSQSGFSSDELKIIPFSEFIDGCRIAYSYPLKRIIIFNPSYPYSYIYSMESKRWGMAVSNLHSVVNAYPDTFANGKDGNLYDISRSEEDSVSVFLLSRPISFGEPDILKTVRTMIQRGVMHKDSLKSALFGSRDLYSWILIHSSQSIAIRNFHGTPYKAFRILFFGTLTPDQSVTGASLNLDAKMINRLR